MHNNYTLQHYTTYTTGLIWFYFTETGRCKGMCCMWSMWSDGMVFFRLRPIWDPKGPFDARFIEADCDG